MTCDFHCALCCISHLSGEDESVFIYKHVKHTCITYIIIHAHIHQTVSAGKEELPAARPKSERQRCVVNWTCWIIKLNFEAKFLEAESVGEWPDTRCGAVQKASANFN